MGKGIGGNHIEFGRSDLKALKQGAKLNTIRTCDDESGSRTKKWTFSHRNLEIGSLPPWKNELKAEISLDTKYNFVPTKYWTLIQQDLSQNPDLWLGLKCTSIGCLFEKKCQDVDVNPEITTTLYDETTWDTDAQHILTLSNKGILVPGEEIG